MKERRKEPDDIFFFLVGILSVIAGALAYTYLSGGQKAAMQQQATPSVYNLEHKNDTGHSDHHHSKGIE